MIDLRRVGDEQHVDLPSDDGVEDHPKRSDVIRQCPLINRDRRNLRAALPQCCKEIRIRHPVFLYCNSDFDERASLIDDLQNVPPGVGLRNRDGRGEPKLLQRGDRLRTAGDHRGAGDGRLDGIQGVGCPKNFDHGLGADTGQEDDHLEMPGQEPLAELQDRRIVGKRNLPQGRRDVRLPPVSLDQSRHFCGHTRFKGGDVQAIEANGRH